LRDGPAASVVNDDNRNNCTPALALAARFKIAAAQHVRRILHLAVGVFGDSHAAYRSISAEQSGRAAVSQAINQPRKPLMPYTRPIRRFYLTPPAVPTFVISVLLAIVAVLAVYGNVPQLHSIGGFAFLLIAYVILLAGTLLRGV
jgi:hypothetical protein